MICIPGWLVTSVLSSASIGILVGLIMWLALGAGEKEDE